MTNSPVFLEDVNVSREFADRLADKQRHIIEDALSQLGPCGIVAIRMKDPWECEPYNIEWEVVSAESLHDLAVPARSTSWHTYRRENVAGL